MNVYIYEQIKELIPYICDKINNNCDKSNDL